MSYKIKHPTMKLGRPRATFKFRKLERNAPEGFEIHKIDKKNKVVIYRKKK